MIKGKGLIASTLSDFENDTSVLIFASGVSNSGEIREEEYKREKDLLLSVLSEKARLIYFSTCSVFDRSLIDSRYVRHKLEMEKLLADNSSNYLIMRLPILVGRTANPNTFFNFICDRVRSNATIQVHKYAWRYLFDAEDLKKVFPIILLETQKEDIRQINVAFNNAASVPSIVEMIEKITGKKVRKEIIENGSNYDFDKAPFNLILEKNKIVIDLRNYNYVVLKKYLIDK